MKRRTSSWDAGVWGNDVAWTQRKRSEADARRDPGSQREWDRAAGPECRAIWLSQTHGLRERNENAAEESLGGEKETHKKAFDDPNPTRMGPSGNATKILGK